VNASARVATVASRPERVGLGVMFALSLGAIALGAGWVTGPSAAVVAAAMLASVIGLVLVAFVGGLETRRALAPYGLLKPGILWLSLFFLAPLWSMVVMSLSSKESRFDFFPSFTWEWDNYRVALTDFRPQFLRSFGYAAIATLLTILIGFPAGLRDRVSRGQVPQHPARTRRDSVLHVVPHQNSRVGQHPRRRRPRRVDH